jgi:hypothetical protein
LAIANLSVFPLARPIMHSILLVMVSRRERGLLKQSDVVVISLVVAIRLDAAGAPIVRSGRLARLKEIKNSGQD